MLPKNHARGGLWELSTKQWKTPPLSKSKVRSFFLSLGFSANIRGRPAGPSHSNVEADSSENNCRRSVQSPSETALEQAASPSELGTRFRPANSGANMPALRPNNEITRPQSRPDRDTPNKRPRHGGNSAGRNRRSDLHSGDRLHKTPSPFVSQPQNWLNDQPHTLNHNSADLGAFVGTGDGVKGTNLQETRMFTPVNADQGGGRSQPSFGVHPSSSGATVHGVSPSDDTQRHSEPPEHRSGINQSGKGQSYQPPEVRASPSPDISQDNTTQPSSFTTEQRPRGLQPSDGTAAVNFSEAASRSEPRPRSEPSMSLPDKTLSQPGVGDQEAMSQMQMMELDSLRSADDSRVGTTIRSSVEPGLMLPDSRDTITFTLDTGYNTNPSFGGTDEATGVGNGAVPTNSEAERENHLECDGGFMESLSTVELEFLSWPDMEIIPQEQPDFMSYS